MKIYKALALLTVFIAAANVMEAPAFSGNRPDSIAPVVKKKKAVKKKPSHTFQRKTIDRTVGI